MFTEADREKWRKERDERRRQEAERLQAAPVVRKRVRAAFMELRQTGLICRMGFRCCMSCATAELEPMLQKRGLSAAVYFHRQDDESFRDGHDLHIRHAPLDGDDTEAWKALGYQVVSALEAQGLTVEWDGDIYNTIVVKTVESYRALKAAEAA